MLKTSTWYCGNKIWSPTVRGGFLFFERWTLQIKSFKGKRRDNTKVIPMLIQPRAWNLLQSKSRSTLWSRLMISISSRLCPLTQSAFLSPRADLTFATEADWGVSVHHLISKAGCLGRYPVWHYKGGCARNIFSYFDILIQKLTSVFMPGKFLVFIQLKILIRLLKSLGCSSCCPNFPE